MTTLYILFFLHWVADFVCQSREMANNKSHDPKWLTYHVVVYSTIMTLPIYSLVPSYSTALTFFFYWFVTHFFTDMITSQLTSKFWKEERIKAFFTTIGFDQFIHSAAIIFAWARFFP